MRLDEMGWSHLKWNGMRFDWMSLYSMGWDELR